MFSRLRAGMDKYVASGIVKHGIPATLHGSGINVMLVEYRNMELLQNR